MGNNDVLRELLKERGVSPCAVCGRELDMGDVAWNNAATEAGTGFTIVEIICQGCDTEAAKINSWYPGIDTFDELVYVIKTDLDN